MKKYVLFFIPIIINMLISIIYIFGDIYGEWFKYGGIAYIQIITNAVILPICVIIIISKNIGKNINKDIKVLLLAYISLKIGLLYDLINSYFLGGNFDAEFKMIFYTEWLFNTVILIIGWIIVKMIMHTRKK